MIVEGKVMTDQAAAISGSQAVDRPRPPGAINPAHAALPISRKACDRRISKAFKETDQGGAIFGRHLDDLLFVGFRFPPCHSTASSNERARPSCKKYV